MTKKILMTSASGAIASSIGGYFRQSLSALTNVLLDSGDDVKVSDYNAAARLWESTRPDMRPGLSTGPGAGTERRLKREAVRRKELESIDLEACERITRQRRRHAERRRVKVQKAMAREALRSSRGYGQGLGPVPLGSS